MMTSEEWEFVNEHYMILVASISVTKETKTRLYEIYNRLTGENKRPNACGRCFTNITRLIKHYYDNYQKI